LAAVRVAENIRRYIAELNAARTWLDSQPQMPQPDWSKAPALATHHAFTPKGGGWWLSNLSDNPIYGGNWNAWHMGPSGIDLPIGLDWRTTLQQRPQGQGTQDEQ
jgi:hypothetical protein